MGVQIRVAGAAVAVGERGRDKASDVDLPDPLRPGPGEQGMLLDKRQRVLHGGLMRAFDRRPQRLVRRPPTMRTLTSPGRTSGHNQQLSGFAAAKFSRSVPPVPARRSDRGHAQRGRTPGPPRSAPAPGLKRAGQRPPADRPPSGSPDAFGDLEAERADVTINDLERRPEPGRVLVVALGEVRPLELLLPQLGKRVQTAAEQCSHLLGDNWVADGQAIDPAQAGTNPHPR